ncbi:MAG: LysR family transcriptional regulator [Pseudomonadota bacterium]
MQLNYGHLYYFYVIAQEGSIVRACKKLHLTQSTLSNQLRQLELDLGQKLFDRKSRQLVLNEAGRMVLDYASEIFGLGENLLSSIKNARIKNKKIIRLGIIPSISKFHVDEFLMDLWRQEDVIVKVREGSMQYMMRDLEFKNLDLILTDTPDFQTNIKTDKFELMPRKLAIVGTKKFANLANNFPASLNGVPFMALSTDNRLGQELENFFRMHKITPDIIGESNTLTLLRLVAEKGICVVPLPKNALYDPKRLQILVKIGEFSSINSSIWAIGRADSRQSDIVLKTLERFR